MAQTVLITLNVAGSDTGPFDLYSDANGYTVPFEYNVSKASLVAGYLSTSVPNGATIVRVKSKGLCPTYVDLPIVGTIYTTTSTTTLFPLTTSSTTTGGTTSTTTTSAIPVCYEYTILNTSGVQQAVQWTDCCTGFNQYEFMDSGSSINVCSRTEPSGVGLIVSGGSVQCQNQCTSTTTTTLFPGTTTTTTTSACKCYMILNNIDATATGTYVDCNGEESLWIIPAPFGRVYICTENSASITVLDGNVSIFNITPGDPLYINCSC